MKQVFIILLSFCLGIAALYLYQHRHIAPVPDTWPDEYNKTRSEILTAISLDSNSVVFIGNSLVEGFPVQLIGSNVVNFGISRNTTHHVLGRIEDVLKAKPKSIILEIGSNDVVGGLDTSDVIFRLRAILQIIRQQSHRTRIILNNIPAREVGGEKTAALIIAMNKRYFDLSKEFNATLLDLYTPTQTNGHLTASLTYDGTHFNSKGYKLWAELLKPLLR